MAESVGFVGLGLMGRGMAANLIKAGFDVMVHNRTASKAEALIAQGAKWASAPAEAVRAGGILITMVADDKALDEIVMGGAGAKLGQGGLHLSMSTIAPETSRRLSAWHRERGTSYVAAPVFGRPAAAAAGKLFILQSGPEAAKVRARGLFEVMGQSVFEFGEDAGAANVIKLCGNYLIATNIAALSEAMTLAQKNGIARKALGELLTQTLFNAPVFHNYAPIVAGFRPEQIGFELKLGYKDMRLVRDCAEQVGVPMPIASVVRDRFLGAIAKGRAEQDWTAICLGTAEDAGLTP